MNALDSAFKRFVERFRKQWPGFPTFLPGFPIGVAVGLPLFFGLRVLWPESVAIAVSVFVIFAVFLLIGIFREFPEMREFRRMGILIVLGSAAAGTGLCMFFGWLIPRGIGRLLQAAGLLP